MSNWERKYFLLKTQTSDQSIGFVCLQMSQLEVGPFYFSMHRPAHKHTEAEYMDLNIMEVPHSEWETHVEVFKSGDELEVLDIWRTATSVSVLVRKPEVNTASTEDTTDADIQAKP